MPNKQVYDSVFRDYLNTPERLLSLCNALLRTSHTNPADVKINTLNWTFFIMQDYLKQRKKEVFDMLNFAYNEEDARLAFIEEGTEIGIQQGIQQERMQQLSQYTSQALAMLKDGLSIDNVARYSPLPLENIKSIAKKNGLL